jgi:anti-anti-sigma factor
MLSFTIHELDEIAVFECKGRLTLEGAKTLRDAVMAHPRVPVAVLDLKQISQVDAAGVGALASLWNWAQTAGTQLKLMNLTPRVTRVLDLTGLRPAFTICSPRDVLDLWCRFLHRGHCTAAAPYLQAVGF